MARLSGERGTITIFVTTTTVALLMAAGLVLDGGRLLAAQRQAVDHASAAARAGAQAVDTGALRERRSELDARRAIRAAQRFLAARGEAGRVTVDGGRIHVTVARRETTSLLTLVGIRTVGISASGSARVVRGVSEGET